MKENKSSVIKDTLYTIEDILKKMNEEAKEIGESIFRQYNLNNFMDEKHYPYISSHDNKTAVIRLYHKHNESKSFEYNYHPIYISNDIKISFDEAETNGKLEFTVSTEDYIALNKNEIFTLIFDVSDMWYKDYYIGHTCWKINCKANKIREDEYLTWFEFSFIKNKYNTLEVYLFGIDENVKSYIEDANQMKGIK